MSMAISRSHHLALTVSADHLIGRYDLKVFSYLLSALWIADRKHNCYRRPNLRTSKRRVRRTEQSTQEMRP